MYQNFDDEKKEKAPRNPFNRHILKGGQVDPGSKLYQRSVAGREKLDAFLQRLWDQGLDEADVFMAGVKALTSRDKGYVGAYLDSNNPGRRYQDNEAKAITDQVMSDLGIGEHPGARLTRPKDSEGKEERKTSNQIRGTFGPSRPEGEAPRKAMPVGQQRKLGKRSSTGQPVEDSSRPSQEEERQKRQEGRQDYYYTDTNVQRKFMDIMKDGTKKIQERVDSGQITAKQAVKEMSDLKDQALTQAGKEDDEKRRYRGDLTPKEQEQADKKQQRVDEMRQRIAEQKGLRDQEAAAGPETEEAIQVNGGIRRSLIVPAIKKVLNTKFQPGDFSTSAELNQYMNDLKKGEPEDPKYLSEMLDRLSQEISDNYKEDTEVNIDPSSIKSSIVDIILQDRDASGVFGKGLASLKSASPGSEQPATAPTETAAAPEPAEGAAAGTKEPAAAPESKAPTPAPEPAEGAAPETEEAPAPAPEAPKEEEEAPAPAPEPEAPAAGPSEEGAPAPRKVTSKGGFKAPPQQGRKKGGGGFGGARAAAPEIMKAGKEAQSLEDFKTYLYNKQGNLLGGRGFETGGSDQEPDPYAKYRGEPAEPELGAQAGGREPATAGRGEEGQGSLLKKGTTEARGDFKKGQKPKPQRKERQRPTSENPPPAKRPSTQNERASRFKELIDSGMSAQKALSIMKQEGSVKTRSAKRSRKKAVSNSEEYQEFAQSIRSMMR